MTEIEQGSAIWHVQRSRRVGGSEVAAVLGISPYMTAYQLWEYKTGRRVQPDISNMPHVQRGRRGEEVARMMIEAQTGHTFKPKTWRVEGTPFGASDDGYNLDMNIFLEIKTMGKDKHEDVARGIIPDYYLCQCQYNLMVSKADECWFYSFRPEEMDETKKLYKVVVKPDSKEQARLKKAVERFWYYHVEKNIPPQLTDKDYKHLDDAKFKELAESFVQLKQQIEELEGRLEGVKAGLQEFTREHPAVKGYGVKVRSYVRQGQIDYKAIPQLSGVDAELYRKPGALVVDVRLDSLWSSGE